jgi:hypothetical protein
VIRAVLPLLALAMIASQVQDARKPVPDEKTQKEFDGIVREVFKDDFARTGVNDRKALVAKLLKQATETKNDPPSLFALLTHARTIAGQIPDIKSGTVAVDELIKHFQVDAVALRKSFLTEAAKTAKTTEELTSLTEGHLQLADQAAAADSYVEAQAAATAASALAKRAKNIPLITRADARVRELGEQKEIGEVVRKAREALAKSPDDAAANFIVGRQECVAGNWDKGLPHLAKGDDAGWKGAAVKEAAQPAAAAEQVALADSWWDVAEKEKGAFRTLLQRRAALWYGRAEGQLSGFTLVRARKRIAEAGGGAAAPPAAAAAPSTLAIHRAFEEAALPDARGGVTQVPGRTGKAAKLDGATGHLVLQDSEQLALSKTGFTVACWINMAGTTHYRLLNKWDEQGKRGWILDLNTKNPMPGAPSFPGHMRVRVSGGGLGLNHWVEGGITAGAWHHVAMTVDFVQKELKLYVDGAAVGAPFALNNVTDVDCGAPLAIGTIPSARGSHFAGMIDDVKVFRQALDAAAVKAMAAK